MTKGILHYSSNNSGGYWPLNDKDWQALEAAGWVVHWTHPIAEVHEGHEPHQPDKYGDLKHSHEYDEDFVLVPANMHSDKRWLGGLATSAALETDDPEAGIDSWREATGKDPGALGCPTCGRPHYFDFRKNGKSVDVDRFIDFVYDDEDHDYYDWGETEDD